MTESQSKGEYRVGVDFNPSGSPMAAGIKRTALTHPVANPTPPFQPPARIIRHMIRTYHLSATAARRRLADLPQPA